MDARHHTAGCPVETFLHKTSPPLCLLETNTLNWFSEDDAGFPVSYLLLLLWDVCTF